MLENIYDVITNFGSAKLLACFFAGGLGWVSIRAAWTWTAQEYRNRACLFITFEFDHVFQSMFHIDVAEIL